MRTLLIFAFALCPLGLVACVANDCPGFVATTSPLAIEVMTSPQKVINDVQATLIGSVTETMSCATNAAGSMCTWSLGAPALTAGTYSLSVFAPGYQTTTVPATVTVSSNCSQTVGSIQPSIVGIDPASDGGVD